MVILGLLLILLGALVIVAALLDLEPVSVELVGIDLNALTVFLLGVVAGVAILWGFGILRFGTRRSLQRRKESKRLSELSEKLDRAEAERRSDGES